MKAVIVTPSTDARSGGVERFCADIGNVLSGLGWKVEFISPKSADDKKWLRRLGLVPMWQGLAMSARIRSRNPHLVITNGTLGVIRTSDAYRLHVYHGTMPVNAWRDRGSRRLLDWLVARSMGGGLCEFLSGLGAEKVAVSNTAAKEVRRLYGYRKVTVIENGVTFENHQEYPRIRCDDLLYVGRRESRKGYEEAVDIANECSRSLRVAGPGTDARTIDLGVLSREELAEFYHEAYALLFPTRYEACSYVILEALSAGCPVVTSRTGWVVDLVRHVPSYAALTVEVGGSNADYHRAIDLAGTPEGAAATEAARQWVLSRNSQKAFAAAWTVRISKVGGANVT